MGLITLVKLWLTKVFTIGTKACNRVIFRTDVELSYPNAETFPKFNGVRSFLLLGDRYAACIVNEQPACFDWYRNNTLVDFELAFLTAHPTTTPSQPPGGLEFTLLDGELIDDSFYSFDALFVNGTYCAPFDFYFRREMMTCFLRHHNVERVQNKYTTDAAQVPIDGRLLVVDAGHDYYSTQIAKIADSPSVDLKVVDDSLCAYENHQLVVLTDLYLPPMLRNLDSGLVYSFYVDKQGNFINRPPLARFDKRTPNDLRTAKLYLRL